MQENEFEIIFDVWDLFHQLTNIFISKTICVFGQVMKHPVSEPPWSASIQLPEINEMLAYTQF